jgi:hypothetical protein
MLPLVFSAQDWILLLRFPKQNGALLIAACIVAAIRLRGEPIARTPKVVATISASVQLAKLVLSELERK